MKEPVILRSCQRMDAECDRLEARVAEQEATIAKEESRSNELAKEVAILRVDLRVQEATIERLTGALTHIDSLAQAGLNSYGERVYDSKNELAIVLLCQSAGAPTKGRRFTKNAALSKQESQS